MDYLLCMTLDEFDNLDEQVQQDMVEKFLNQHPDHPENIDNGQDPLEVLYNDAEFISFLENN